MNTLENVYETREERSGTVIKFFFTSRGQHDFIKIIQYSFVQVLGGRDIYNLGFGDYDAGNGLVIDHINTNNGDAYKIFNTVLLTIPVFFEVYRDAVLMVQGSDGRPEFVKSCKLSCTKKCDEKCKKINRRINIYKRYIDKHYQRLTVDYKFFGGNKDDNEQTTIEEYEPGRQYDIVFLLKNT
jgi:hypothetical protein